LGSRPDDNTGLLHGWILRRAQDERGGGHCSIPTDL